MTTNGNPQVNLRNIVLTMLCKVEDGAKSHIVLKETLDSYDYLDKQKRAFVTVLFKGTIERQIELDYIINQFSKTKVSKMKQVIRNIIRLSVYQLKYMNNVPDSAACNEAVKLVNKRKMSGLKGFVNGVLRNISRSLDKIEYPKDKKEYLSVCYSIPMWIIEMWSQQYGIERTEQILNSLYETNEYTTIRVDSNKMSPKQVIVEFEKENISVKQSELYGNALYIKGYDSLEKLKLFEDGIITVQDESSMLVGLTSGVKENDYVMDVCAAPGGKSIHISQLMNGTGRVQARDLTENKERLIKENISRMKIKNIETKVWDGTKEDKEAIGKADVVIADVPCSGLGIIGNKSDIKHNVSKKQIFQLVEIQRKILEQACKYVKIGGRLVYSTCTVNKYENNENVEWIEKNLPLRRTDFGELFPKNLDNGNGMIQIFPGDYNMDGFFISVFEKIKD
jgi:ribosomal RNA small subunit methyltransferase B